jgi:hypothetical protein
MPGQPGAESAPPSVEASPPDPSSDGDNAPASSEDSRWWQHRRIAQHKEAVVADVPRDRLARLLAERSRRSLALLPVPKPDGVEQSDPEAGPIAPSADGAEPPEIPPKGLPCLTGSRCERM